MPGTSPGALVPSAGTVRRLQALMARGWSRPGLARRLGISRWRSHALLAGAPVTCREAAAVRRVYDDLWDAPPPARTAPERQAAGRAVAFAGRRGWAVPLAWDDDPGPHCIDDPSAVPAPGWRRTGRYDREAIAEDARWLMDTQRLTPVQAAERMGISRDVLRTALAQYPEDEQQQEGAAA